MASEPIPLYKPTEHQTPETKVDHSAQQGSLGVHPSEKKKEVIIQNPNETESPHKNLPPELKRSNPNPNADRPKEPSRFSFEKSAQKDTDPNAPKLPDKPKEPSRFSLENRSKTTTPPSSNVVKTVPNQTPEQVVRKDDPIVPQQALNTPAKAPSSLLKSPQCSRRPPSPNSDRPLQDQICR
jgi:hypothetical protein